MGRVEILKLFPGKDGLVRTVELRTQKGNLCRPIQRLHRLEILAQNLMMEKLTVGSQRTRLRRVRGRRDRHKS